MQLRSSVLRARREEESLSFDDAVACNGASLRAALRNSGYCVVRGVVNDAQKLSAWRENLVSFLSSLGWPGRFDDAASVYKASDWPLGCPGIFDGFGSGHTLAAWEARLEPRVRAIFAALWQTRHLVTSLDAVCCERPRRTALANNLLLHTDQNPYSCPDEMHAVQGVVSLTATNESSGGTTVLAGSHALHCAMLRDVFPTPELEASPLTNWHVCTPPQLAWLAQRGCVPLHLSTQPGDLVLFDSRTVHCGRLAKEPQPHTAWRFAVYVCMWPASRLKARDREAKRAATGLSGRRCETTTHWPDARELKPRYGWPPGEDVSLEEAHAQQRPKHAKNDGIVVPPACALTPDALRLAGVEPYSSDSD